MPHAFKIIEESVSIKACVARACSSWKEYVSLSSFNNVPLTPTSLHSPLSTQSLDQ
jgi:hypothetical protein